MTHSVTKLSHYAECRVLFIIMMNAIVLSVIMPSVVVPIK